ncbi:MAG: hypothetical protein Q9170_002957 [Blastenia crenularia]
MVKFPLAGLTIAATGDFGSRRTHENLKRWIEKNGGQWATKISPEVTHLVCTKEDYLNKTPMGNAECPMNPLNSSINPHPVKQALRLKLFTIVTYDWLEDSLMKGFRMAVKGNYLVARAIKEVKKVKKEKKRTKKETIKKGGSFVPEPTSMPALFTDRYQIHRDSTRFAYDIILIRVNLLQNKSERYVLRLCTTHDVPKHYASLLTYHTRDRPAQKSVLAPIGSDWTTAFGAFTKAFKAKTKVEWDERLKVRRGEEGAFVYTPPKEGEPVGEMDGDFEIRGLNSGG